MPYQVILENLARLENSLQNINSAKEQVETLSNSYDKTEKQLKIVASEIASIVKDLNNIFNTIKINNEQVSNDLYNFIDLVI